MAFTLASLHAADSAEKDVEVTVRTPPAAAAAGRRQTLAQQAAFSSAFSSAFSGINQTLVQAAAFSSGMNQMVAQAAGVQRIAQQVARSSAVLNQQFAKQAIAASGINQTLAQAAAFKLGFAIKGDVGRFAAGLTVSDQLAKQFASSLFGPRGTLAGLQSTLVDAVSPAVTGLAGRLEDIDRWSARLLRRHGERLDHLFADDAIRDLPFGTFEKALAVLTVGGPSAARYHALRLKHSGYGDDGRVGAWLLAVIDVITRAGVALHLSARLVVAAVWAERRAVWRLRTRHLGWHQQHPPPPQQRDLHALVHAAHAPPTSSVMYRPEAV